MGVKREDSERIDLSARADLTPTVSQVLRAVDEAAKAGLPKPGPSDEQRMSLFWRVFGGTILSIAALVAITLFNNITTGISDLRAEVVKSNEARSAAVIDLRAEIARVADSRAELVRKDEFNTRVSTTWTEVRAMQAQNSAQNAQLTSLKAECDGLKDRLTRSAVEADALRKEQAATVEAAKKDVAALEVLKERLAGLVTEHAAGKEVVAKLQGEVRENQAGDKERKERRDTLQRHTEEAIKELTKAVGDCREKLARLEGQAGPPAPDKPAPKKPAVRD